MNKKFIALLIVVMMLLVLFSAVALADDEADGGEPGNGDPQEREERAAARMEKWLERKAKIAERKAQLEARKEAFFALKEQTKQEVAAQKALIKELKALIIEQVHSINEMEPHERKTLKGQIKQLWKEVRDTQRYLWQVRQTAVDSAHGILGKVEVIGSGVGAEDLELIEDFMDQL
ncbi:MAG: hypothetical protein HN389_07750 [Clostridia bacterium]|jgi:hypothetical protein|nr:hypothetical protein [Clostridia bacterium]